ncbi:hypothetical protein BD309DRAFT_863131 [Dichomitus squalens]|uniref:Uncharacterized protein n=1 Tax=Dichomitus squalens TaxID=114155 RepID=A0A4Q9PK17_9APHY|nr:hypothetical protein BD309DRAFT_863131 [Dichomitus squalens]TBU54479.1 hypothetical protein BD310DRAFT_1041777 [Dichomitus squalens]
MPALPAKIGNGGLVVPEPMRDLIDIPGRLQIEQGGQALRTLYQRNSSGFQYKLLNDFAQKCFLGDIKGVRRMVEGGKAPPLDGTETPYEYGYAMLVVSGGQRMIGGPSGVKVDHKATLRYLLEHGAPPDVPDIVGYTALHHVCMAHSRPDLARILLEHGADPNSQDKFGSVPLMGAFQNNSVEAVEVLMEFGAKLDIEDADGCTPDEFYIKCGPTITAAVQKWKRKRSGESTAMDEKRCAACGSSAGTLKFCNACHAIRYCSKQCQRSHWSLHKTRCIPFSADSTVTLTPFYEDIGPVMSLADVARSAFGFPVEKQPARNARSVQIPYIRPGETKKIIIKVQVPFSLETGGPTKEELGDLMVYDKRRNFVCRIRRADGEDGYLKLSRSVRAYGVAGAKAYFPAELKSKDELIVKYKEVLGEQPF